MQSLQVKFDESTRTIEHMEAALPEPWDRVCEHFDNDVHRIMDVTEHDGYTALFVCYDERNEPEYYLVEEDEALFRLRRKTFLGKLGKIQPQGAEEK